MGAASPPASRHRTPVADAVAGGLAGAAARLVVGPLDVLKIRFQVQLEPVARGAPASKYTGLAQAVRTIVKEEGVAGLWRGTVPGLLLTVPYTAVQFVTLEAVRSAFDRAGWTRATAPPRRRRAAAFGSGAAAGAAATVASYPFDLLRTTLAAQGEPRVYSGVASAARAIVRDRGVRGLYAGLGVTLVEIVPYAALQFGLYDAFTAAAARKSDTHAASPAARFVCGLAAGTAAKLATHPLDVAKKRYQVAGLARPAAYGARVPAAAARATLRSAITQIAAAEGVAGLYKGALPSILKAAPQAAVTLAAYEFCAGLLTGLAR